MNDLLYWKCPNCGASLDECERCEICHPFVGVPMFPIYEASNYQSVTPTINNNTHGGGTVVVRDAN